MIDQNDLGSNELINEQNTDNIHVHSKGNVPITIEKNSKTDIDKANKNKLTEDGSTQAKKESDEEKKKEEEEKEKKKAILEQEKELVSKASGMYKISVLDLENLMGNYKERGSECSDLTLYEGFGGPEGLMEKLKTDPKNGITSLENRENDFGSNKVFVEPVPPFCAYVLDALDDLMIRILIVAAVVQIILGATLSDDPSKDWVDGLSIVIAVVVVVTVGSVTNWQKENKFHELNDLQNQGTTYKVIRNGQPSDMKSDDLLVGDLINIMVGDIIPADLILLEGNGIKMDESSLTGESDYMKKESLEKCKKEVANKGAKSPSPCILSGTNCVEGTGYAIVIAVGEHSQKGIIRRTVDNAQENNQTPLEEKLESIAETIGWFGMAAGAVTLVALFIRFGIKYPKDMKTYKKNIQYHKLLISYNANNPDGDLYSIIDSTAYSKLKNPKKNISNEVLDIILLCVSIIVVAIPEGLPLAVTLSLAFSIKKLMDKNNLVRKMHACETMGGANYICTDKTGTLTKNEMNVFKVLTGNEEFELEETMKQENAGNIDANVVNTKIREDFTKYFKNEKYWELLKTSIALNIDGQIKTFDKEDINGDKESCETKNKTDMAFIDFLYRFKSPISEQRSRHTPTPASMKQIPFDSKRKRMTTFVHSENFEGTQFRLFTKGGAENVKKFCKYYIDSETGEKKDLDDAGLTRISERIQEFNKQMLRSLYVCYKDISEQEFNDGDKPDSQLDSTDLTFLAVLGIRDSLRNGVKEAVLRCKDASVKVIMVTGDNIITATAIAKDCNILGEEVDLKTMSPNDIEEDPEATNDPNKRDEHIKKILNDHPHAITGNTFYAIIGGLICDVCKEETNLCKCPKTEAEAQQIAKATNTEPKKVKSDTIKEKENFKTITKELRVMARSQPIHKYSLVLGLREMGFVVAVTGDGTNDAPALSKSNVGFAMFAGTDIAKEASDIVIMDNSFSSIVIAIIFGRNIYDNIRKFLQFQLTVNFCACLLVFICACVGNETPLTPIQMLWVNLIMDSLGSLALATEPPYQELLNREPTKKSESIINGKMWKHIIFQSLIQLLLLIALYLWAPLFLEENNAIRKSENSIILYCYGELPGGKSDPDMMIFGTSTKWSENTQLQAGMNEYQCGKYASSQNLSSAYTQYINSNGSSSHITLVFNVFVIYTLFNQINARVIDDSFNIFVRINRNIFFPIITLSELVLQILIIEFGNAAFKVCEGGLTGKQWGYTVGFSAITFVLSIIIKLIPIDKCIDNIIVNNFQESDEIAIGTDNNKDTVSPKDKNKEVEVVNDGKDILSLDRNNKNEELETNNNLIKKEESKRSISKRLSRRGSSLRVKKEDFGNVNI